MPLPEITFNVAVTPRLTWLPHTTMARTLHLHHTLALVAILLTTLYLLFRVRPQPPPSESYTMLDNSLASRMQRAHHIYDKRISQRSKLIKKFGPEPKNISLYVVLCSKCIRIDALQISSHGASISPLHSL